MLNEITNNLGNNDINDSIDPEFQYIDKGFIDELKFTTGTGKELTVTNISVDTLKALVGEIDNLTSKQIKVTEIVFDEILGKLLFGDKVALSAEGFTLKIAEGFTFTDIRSTSRPTWQSSQLALTSDISNPLKLIGVGKTEDRPTEDLQPGDYYLSTDEPPLTVYVYGTDKVWHQFVYQTLDMYRSATDQDVIDAEIKQSIIDNKKVSDEKDEDLQTQINDLSTKEAEDIDDIKSEITVINGDIDSIKDEQTTQNNNIQSNTEAIATKIEDAPANTTVEQASHYARSNKEWKAIDNLFDSKFVPTQSNKYTSVLIAGTRLIKQEVVVHDDKYIGLWNINGAFTDQGYTTKQAYDYVEANKESLDATIVKSIEDAYMSKLVIGTTHNNFGEFVELPFDDLASNEGTQIDLTEELPVSTNNVLSSSMITNTEDGINVSTNKSLQISTPGKDYPLNDKAPINIDYLHDRLKISTVESENDRVLMVKTYNAGADPLSTAASVIPNAESANSYGYNVAGSDWYRRTKDYVYYKVDNVANQTASSFSFWFSIDKDGNVINMTDPGADLEQAVAGQSDFEKWITYHPSAWNGATDNVAYFVRSGTNRSIEMYDNGKHIGHITDGDGYYTFSTLSVPVVNQESRAIGGKSLRRNTHPRCIVVNNSTTAAVNVTAGIIGVDKYGNEGLNKYKEFSLLESITYGPYGVAAGNNHWFIQAATTNTFMVVDGDGECKSYVLSDPTTNTVLGATVRNVKNNYIELENGDCMFYVVDSTTKKGYFIYCRDNFTEDENPFIVYPSALYYATSDYPLAEGFPFVEFGNFVYFFPTISRAIADTVVYPDAAMSGNYTRFNKTTKEFVDFHTPWNNAAEQSQTIAVKTYDKEENKDYLWLFQSQSATSTTAPRQYLCVVIAEDGEIQHIDIKNSTRTPWYDPEQDPVDADIPVDGTGNKVSEDIAWFDGTAVTGQTLLATYTWPLNGSGTVEWKRPQTSKPTTPYVAVTRKGIGVMVSNTARDVMVFYGNGKFYRRSYPNQTSQGPWSNFSTELYLNIGMLPGIDGVKLVVKFNNDLIGKDTTNNNSSAIIYIKVDADDPLKEPKYFWKPYPVHTLNRRYWDRYDGEYCYITDTSEYKRITFQDITPLSAGYNTTTSMTAYEIEAPVVSKTLYLKDDQYTISSTNI